VDPGFNPQNVLTARIDLNWSKYPNGAKVKPFTDALLQQLQATPGVLSAAVASRVPLNGQTPASQSMQIEKHPVPPGQPGPAADLRLVSQSYFSTVGMTLFRGRTFTAADSREKSDVAIINQAMARRYWGNEDPIGTRVSLDGGDNWLTIVGVV